MVLIGIAVAVGSAVWLVEVLRLKRLEGQRATREKERGQWYYNKTMSLCFEHHDSLWRRYRQLRYEDSYGNWVNDRWDKELIYFFERVIRPALTNSTREEHLQVFNEFKEWANDHFGFGLSDFEPDGATEASDGLGYERLVAAALVNFGFDVSFTPASGDQGVDLVATRAGQRIAIQCKNYATAVGNEAVQQVYAGAKFYDAHRAIVVAPNGFTRAGLQLATALGVDCFHHNEVGDRLVALSGTATKVTSNRLRASSSV